MAHDFKSNYEELALLRREQEFEPELKDILLNDIRKGYTEFGNPATEFIEILDSIAEYRMYEIAAVQRLLTLHHRFNRTRHRNRA